MQAHLTRAELELLIEALDSHEYWQLSDPAYRNDGFVIGKGAEEREAVKDIHQCRELRAKLEALSLTRLRAIRS
jgi:hypothetical protein